MPRVAGGLVLLVAVGCQPSGPHVVFEIPVGFTGEVWVVDDPAGGTPFAREGDKYVVKVPHNGVRKAASVEVLRQRHSESARFWNGTVLLRDSRNIIPDDVTTLRGGVYVSRADGGRSVAFVAYYVGNKERAQKFLDNPRPPPE
ncbi:MAG TPA: hypothetical protein VD866_23990 [Urbifossiella sp.]|nr:hypothetical protein [Urbifossiella sp.]